MGRLLAITLTLILLPGCNTERSSDLNTDDIEVKYEIYIPQKSLNSLFNGVVPDSDKSRIEISSFMKTLDSHDKIAAVSLNENDRINVIYKNVIHEMHRDTLAFGIHRKSIYDTISDNDNLTIEFVHNEESIKSNIAFGKLPNITSEYEVSISSGTPLLLRWNNNSANANRLYLFGSCFGVDPIDLDPLQDNYDFDINELEMVANDVDTCSGLAVVEWTVIGGISQFFRAGSFTTYLRKWIKFTIE